MPESAASSPARNQSPNSWSWQTGRGRLGGLRIQCLRVSDFRFSEFQYLSFFSPAPCSAWSLLKVYILLAKGIKNDTVRVWTALCPQSSFEQKRAESRCANGYRGYRNMRGE